MSTDHATTNTPGVVHERILHVLGLATRPLRSGEIESALGLVADDANSACGWLTQNGYVVRTEESEERSKASRELTHKGRQWIGLRASGGAA